MVENGAENWKVRCIVLDKLAVDMRGLKIEQCGTEDLSTIEKSEHGERTLDIDQSKHGEKIWYIVQSRHVERIPYLLEWAPGALI